ncbi:MAG: PTS sugar transporter subunit IIA [Treponema sp.]|jgi:PTS system nitrogen regulatory IIA component|nr:PTS sugar transporter subunit IIA [Treponema sp.]
MENVLKPALSDLIRKGGVLYDIPGINPEEVLTNMTRVLQVPPGFDREALLAAVLEREALMPTSIGHGIALPHPRNPIIGDNEEQFVTIGFLKWSVDWKTLDKKPVHSLMLIVSASAKLHLDTLSRINFFCQQPSFRQLLKDRSSLKSIIGTIQEAEQGWK